MDYILSGNPKDVEKVIRENRIRIQRGVIKFTPLEDAVPCDEPNAVDEPEAGSKTEIIPDTPAEADDVKDTPESDTKAEPESDTKIEPEADTKAEPIGDVKEPEFTAPEADTKTTKAKRTKKSE